MLRAGRADISFVPRPAGIGSDGSRLVVREGLLWDLVSWMPGEPINSSNLSRETIEPACAGLATLHRAWRVEYTAAGPCPAVAQRLARLSAWRDGGHAACFEQLQRSPIPWRPTAASALEVLGVWSDRSVQDLEPWMNRTVRVQPCHGDARREHFLLMGRALAGVVDHDAVRIDHVAADIARLLGSLAQDDPARWEAGFRAYRAVNAISGEEQALARLLDRTGTLAAIANWLQWSILERRPGTETDQARNRCASLVARAQKWRAASKASAVSW